MKLAIDGDVLIYRAAFVAQAQEKKEGLPEGSMEWLALKALQYMVQATQNNISPEEFVVVLSNPDNSVNYRYKVDPEYKAGRPPKPAHYNAVRTKIGEAYPTIVAVQGEADDVLGHLAGQGYVIASIDKDLRMVPGTHYDINSKEVFFVSDPGTLTLVEKSNKKKKLEGCGFKWFCAQMLMGDRVDNIKGIPKCGDVRAYNCLRYQDTRDKMWLVVKKKYERAGILDRMEPNSKLLWIQRVPGQIGPPEVPHEG